jgi:hypothetical protein
MKLTLQKIYSWGFVLAMVAIFGVLYMGVLFPLMNRWGATNSEVVMSLPGDQAANGAKVTSTRAITIHAPAREVWKWVVQLGQERAGFYSNDWLENLTLADIHNGNEIRPEWQQHQLGDKVYGAGGAVYGQTATWTIPLYEEGKATYLWGYIEVVPVDAQTSRLLTRSYAGTDSPAALAMNTFTYDWMHFVMERGMLIGIKSRAEQNLGADAFFRAVAALGWVLATLGIGIVLFARRRGWWWGLIPLAYAVSIILFTADIWSALAGFLWWGVVAAGFILWGRGWWKGLLLSILVVILIFVLSNQPHTVFGFAFLLVSLSIVVSKFTAPKYAANIQLVETEN